MALDCRDCLAASCLPSGLASSTFPTAPPPHAQSEQLLSGFAYGEVGPHVAEWGIRYAEPGACVPVPLFFSPRQAPFLTQPHSSFCTTSSMAPQIIIVTGERPFAHELPSPFAEGPDP